MTKLSAAVTVIEADLPPIITKLELISPFIFTKISLNDKGTTISSELMSLEWLSELCSFLNQDLYPPSEYRTNLTPGGDEFYARLVADCSLALRFYDKESRSKLQVTFTAPELVTFIGVIYDQLVDEFRARLSSERPIEEHRAQTLAAVAAWKERMARKAG